MSNFVRMFKPQFAPLVENGTKCRTIRPTPKRIPRPGDRISLRTWAGSPYRSKQRVLREAEIESVSSVYMALGVAGQLLISVDGGTLQDEEAFARADGFKSLAEMRDWFAVNHSLPFEGILIRWKP